jgi:hypothetical protein
MQLLHDISARVTVQPIHKLARHIFTGSRRLNLTRPKLNHISERLLKPRAAEAGWLDGLKLDLCLS